MPEDSDTTERHNDANTDQRFEKTNEFPETEESIDAYPQGVTSNESVKENLAQDSDTTERRNDANTSQR